MKNRKGGVGGAMHDLADDIRDAMQKLAPIGNDIPKNDGSVRAKGGNAGDECDHDFQPGIETGEIVKRDNHDGLGNDSHVFTRVCVKCGEREPALKPVRAANGSGTAGDLLGHLVGRCFATAFCPTCKTFAWISINGCDEKCPVCSTKRELVIITVEKRGGEASDENTNDEMEKNLARREDEQRDAIARGWKL